MSSAYLRALLGELCDNAEARRELAEMLRCELDCPAPGMKRSDAAAQRWLTCAQAARHAGIHVETIRRAVRSGALPAGRVGRSLRIALADLEAWLTSGKPTGGRAPRPRASRRAPRAGRWPKRSPASTKLAMPLTADSTR